MPSWSTLLSQFQKEMAKKPPNLSWLPKQMIDYLEHISDFYKKAAVIYYASGFLQKPDNKAVSITREDLNGFMNALCDTPTDKGLILILHTPGGETGAAESIVEYLHAKFPHITVIVPYLAMSAGAMISLASDHLILGKQSQLGPIDPQIHLGGQYYSARAIKEEFDKAKKDIESNLNLAHLWAPILQNMGPALVSISGKALIYSQELVKNWLCKRRLIGIEDAEKREEKAIEIAEYFNAEEQPQDRGRIHDHGQRIGIEKLQKLDINVEVLEENQALQDYVLTVYHLMTLVFEHTNSIKFILDNKGKMWNKDALPAQQQPQ